MKASHSAIARSILASGALTVVGCVPAPDSTPAPSPSPVVQAPAPSPTPRPTTAPAPAPAVQFENLIDAPQTPGDWRLATSNFETVAKFGELNAEPRFSLFCDRRSGRITIMRSGNAPQSVQTVIRTETTDRVLSMSPARDSLPVLQVTLPARDPLFDAMAVTRGRFAVETPELSTLYLPAWAEVTRVIEDCR